jgi:hypothetical protein
MMNIERKLFTTGKPGQSQSSQQSSSFNINTALENTRKRMGQFFKGNQILGRKGTIGCVSLEITQRLKLLQRKDGLKDDPAQ